MKIIGEERDRSRRGDPGEEAVLVHDRTLESYGFGGDHPFNPLRIRLTFELCEALGLTDSYAMVGAEPATDDDLTTVHSLTYVRRVQQCNSNGPNRDDLLSYGIGTADNPIFPGMHRASSHVVGAVLKASRMVMSGEVNHALCISGGLHHAMRSRAAGFCVYNDAGVAIARLKEEHPGIKIAYVDTDAHHGDGVQWMFYDDPQVLTISMHETGRFLFPGTGEVGEKGRGDGLGYSVNVPLEPFTSDDTWIETFEAVVPEALRAFGPDIIISQNGCDGHVLDPLTHLSATMRLYRHIPRRIHDLAHELCKGRWVATGGGGYDIWRVVPRAWTTLWAVMSHQTVPEHLPQGWLLERGMQSPVTLPEMMLDLAKDFPPAARAREIAAQNRKTATEVLEKVVPLIL
ncbi:acetoin utilization protein AcuC [Rubrobacter indicoceani]|uniref:acetoin utilization protein AcuC n=1 Tax=Rubrobacter indicoceani TaxID=2051957 RepID=UPI000E5A592B|nr:acetoin utilization protein AcuC [Rubrobacter indicoceani]